MLYSCTNTAAQSCPEPFPSITIRAASPPPQDRFGVQPRSELVLHPPTCIPHIHTTHMRTSHTCTHTHTCTCIPHILAHTQSCYWYDYYFSYAHPYTHPHTHIHALTYSPILVHTHTHSHKRIQSYVTCMNPCVLLCLRKFVCVKVGT